MLLAIAALLGVGLTRDPTLVPSPSIDEPAPAFTAPELHDPARMITERDLRGRVSLVNVWASGCAACRDEHPLLMELAATGEVPVYGLDYEDERSDAIAWLGELGDPYTAVAVDREGGIGIDWGVYGVPETFVVDRDGIIRYKHVGPIDAKSLKDVILPLVYELEARGPGS